jgi:eukaryotic-like serine/threonine-protein kinase
MVTVYGGRWEHVRNLSGGGQGVTTVVRDRTGVESRECVMKRLKNVESPERLARFKTEVATLERLDHPNVVRYVDADLEAEKPWVVTEYCAGGDLSRAHPYWRDGVAAGSRSLPRSARASRPRIGRAWCIVI